MKKAGKLFLNGLIKSFIFLTLLIFAGVLCYHAVFKLFHIPEEVEEVSLRPTPEPESITTPSIDDISKHLIYCVDDNGEVIKLLLEIFNCEERKLGYFTIPVETRITMSDNLYRELMLVNPSVPQIMKLSGLTKQFPEEAFYEYGVLLIEELLDMKLSYYSVVPSGLYESVFATEEAVRISNGMPDAEQGDGARVYPREVFSEEFMIGIHNFKTEEELRDYLEMIYDDITSNLSFEDKMNYLESYLKLTAKNITFEVIAGENTNSAYMIDRSGAAKQIAGITGQTR